MRILEHVRHSDFPGPQPEETYAHDISSGSVFDYYKRLAPRSARVSGVSSDNVGGCVVFRRNCVEISVGHEQASVSKSNDGSFAFPHAGTGGWSQDSLEDVVVS